jgi:hypothetical protein
MHRLVLVGLCALVVVGCDAFLEDEVALPRCSGKRAVPIETKTVVEALRREGFSAEVQKRSELCSAPDTVAEVSNFEHAEEGALVGCGVREAPLRGKDLEIDLDAPPASPIFSGDKVLFWLANVECTLYPNGDDEEGQVERLTRAMETLEASL